MPGINDDVDLFFGDERSFFAAPASAARLAALYAAHADAVLVAGTTDLGRLITKNLRTLPKIIWLGRVRGLDAIEQTHEAVTFGAMVSPEAARPYLAAIDPHLGEMLRRFAGTRIRTVGAIGAATIGGTVASGSPIGDTPPALIALGATLTLQRGTAQRHLPLERFLLGY